MTAKEIAKRNQKAEQLKVLQTDDGQFFVESGEGKILYNVSLDDEGKTCTCGDFAKNSKKDPNFNCKHILSVMNAIPKGEVENGKFLEKLIPKLDERFLTNIKGKDFVLYAGVLDLATQKGLLKLEVELIQFPNKDNGSEAICHAVAVGKNGEVFADIGDANPTNCHSMIAKHLIRMASTRAKARALRDMCNIGIACVEELSDFEDVIGSGQPKNATQKKLAGKADTKQPKAKTAAKKKPPAKASKDDQSASKATKEQPKMAKESAAQATIIKFPVQTECSDNARKTGLNRNKEGSVRKLNGKVYVDFMYLGERVRESSDLAWNDKNAKHVRDQLDKIIVGIKSGTFRYAEVFPNSKKADYFTEKEQQWYGLNKTADQVLFKDYAWTWYNLLKDSGRVSERTLWGYKGYMTLYLIPYFGELTFADLNKSTFDKFVSWAKKLKIRDKAIRNESINKIFVPLKMICKDAAIEYGWGSVYNPFFGFKKLPPEGDSYGEICPFSMAEQSKILASLPDHWKPYFDAAFKIGLRQGEQIAIKPDDIDWSKGLLHIRRAFTRDADGKVMLGKTKNKYSRRTIKLIPVMLDVLKAQKKIYDQFKGKYFFCSKAGKRVDRSHLRQRVWTPALKRAGVKYREIKQTRHSFATNALSCGENPLWISKVMGHRDTDMIIRVYSKFIENAGGVEDGTNLNAVYQGSIKSKE